MKNSTFTKIFVAIIVVFFTLQFSLRGIDLNDQGIFILMLLICAAAATVLLVFVVHRDKNK